MTHDLTMEEVLQILEDLAGTFGPSIKLSSLIQAIKRNRHQFDCVGCGLSMEALSPLALLGWIHCAQGWLCPVCAKHHQKVAPMPKETAHAA